MRAVSVPSVLTGRVLLEAAFADLAEQHCVTSPIKADGRRRAFVERPLARGLGLATIGIRLSPLAVRLIGMRARSRPSRP